MKGSDINNGPGCAFLWPKMQEERVSFLPYLTPLSQRPGHIYAHAHAQAHTRAHTICLEGVDTSSSVGKDFLQCWRPGLHPRVGTIPWRRARQPTPVFLPGESPWTEEPGGLQSMELQKVGHNWANKHELILSLIFYFNCNKLEK